MCIRDRPTKLAAIVAAPKSVLSRVIVMGFVFPHAKESVVHEWAVCRRYGKSPVADLFMVLRIRRHGLDSKA